MIGWGLRHPDRYFQFPTLLGATWLFYIGPFALAVLNNPGLLPAGAVADGGIEMALLMANLCAGFSFLGYLQQPKRSWRFPSPKRYSVERLFWGGCVLVVMSCWGLYKISRLTGGILAFYSTEGASQLAWTGLPVAYMFFIKMAYPGLILCLWAALRKPSWVKWTIVIISFIIPLGELWMGRRTETVYIVLIFGMVFHFERGWVPQRSMIIFAMVFGMVFGMVMHLLLPIYRDYFQLGTEHSQMLEIDAGNLISARLKGEDSFDNTFQYAAIQLAATHRALEFNYGVGFINRLIEDWVPAQLNRINFENWSFLE